MLIELTEISMILERILKILKERMVNTLLTSDQLKSESKRKRTIILALKKTSKVKIIPTHK
jgi:hypothetical protein